MGKKSLKILMGGAVLALSSCTGWYVLQGEHRASILEIYIFNSKSGRSMFIRTPNDDRIVVNGGGDSGILRELTLILPFYSRRIDTVVATCDKWSDVSGLANIVERYKVGRAYLPLLTAGSLDLASSTDAVYDTFVELLDNKKIPVNRLSSGQFADLGGGVSMRTLFPIEAGGFVYSKTSAPELLFQLRFGKTSFVFAGNSTKKIQRAVSEEFMATSTTDVLIFSRNISPGDLSPELANIFRPEYLVYSKAIRSRVAPKQYPDGNGSSKSSNSSSVSKVTTDPYGYVSDGKRFNLKEGSIKITSDGGLVTVERMGE